MLEKSSQPKLYQAFFFGYAIINSDGSFIERSDQQTAAIACMPFIGILSRLPHTAIISKGNQSHFAIEQMTANIKDPAKIIVGVNRSFSIKTLPCIATKKSCAA